MSENPAPDLRPRRVVIHTTNEGLCWAEVLPWDDAAPPEAFGPIRSEEALRTAIAACHPQPNLVHWNTPASVDEVTDDLADRQVLARAAVLLPAELVRGCARPERLIATFPYQKSRNRFLETFDSIDVLFGADGYSVWFGSYRLPHLNRTLKQALNLVCEILERQIPQHLLAWATGKALKEKRPKGAKAVAKRLDELLSAAIGDVRPPSWVADPFGLES